MRVSQFSIVNPYLNSLQDIQSSRSQNQIRMSTGKDIIGLGDAPDKIPDIKKIGSLISQNDDYLKIISDQISQFQLTENYLTGISDKMEKIRQLTIDATNVGNMGNLSTLGNYVKGIISDIVKDANADYNGSFIFSGTATKASAFDPNVPNANDMPFELIEGTPTQDNPSGMSVVFKGNQDLKTINKDQKTSEVVSTNSEEIFGQGGTEVFNYLIQLHNLVAFKSDGSPRGESDVLTIDEVNKLNDIQAKIAKFSDQINQVTARNGGRSNRFQVLSDQITEENSRLQEYLSTKSDTDFAKVAIDLSKDEYSLQYALQVGSRMLQNSLFDFLQ